MKLDKFNNKSDNKISLKKKVILSIVYCFITLIITFILGEVLLRLFPDGKSIWASILFIAINLTPMFVALLLSLISRQCSNILIFIKDVFLQKEKLITFLFALAIPLIYYSISIIISNVTFTNEPFLSFLSYLPWAILQGGLEEVGWRWYLQKTLPIKSFVIRMLIISIVWFLWHIPIYRLPWITAASSNYFIFYLMILGNTFTLGALFEISKGSLPCILSHMLIDSFAVLLTVNSDLECILILVMIEIFISLVFNKKNKI